MGGVAEFDGGFLVDASEFEVEDGGEAETAVVATRFAERPSSDRTRPPLRPSLLTLTSVVQPVAIAFLMSRGERIRSTGLSPHHLFKK
ncbi:hypothetical protein ACIPSA_41950 [Streptomyces sp. NPDC086549]|uniref:hypothetical protein n=1 Tax=Streptomyces sp. NPDC086549 TaxID=3365752 RepID=UPI0038226C56